MHTESLSVPQRLVFPAKQEVLLEPYEPGTPREGEVLVRTRLSLMSTGTENIVFNRLFDKDSHWDRWVKYPFYPGYASVGVVEALGPGVDNLRVGNRVAFRKCHRSVGLVEAHSCYLIPDQVSFEQAIWFALAKIAFHGALAADYRIGDSVLVIGAGPVGQMSIRWARAGGLSVIGVVDPAADRMPLALAGGATNTFALPIAEARDAILSTCGKLPRVVIDSTGAESVFSSALGLANDGGRVVLLGDTGRPTQQSLTGDVLVRGLTVVGAHDAQNTEQWNNATIAQLFFNLVGRGAFPLEGMNSHTFLPERCADAYAMANRDRAKTMGIVFDWVR